MATATAISWPRLELDSASGDTSKLFVYGLANYESGGHLLDVYRRDRMQGLIGVLRSNRFKSNMYCNGNGKEFSTSKASHIVCNVNDDCKQINQNTRRVCWKLHLRGLYGESLLHILIINNSKTHSLIAKQILHLYPNLVNDVFEETQYFGVSGLHLAIIYKNEILIETLLECNANVHQRAVGSFFVPKTRTHKKSVPSFDEPLYFGEYPLSWAASIGNKRIYNNLISFGANPNLPDSFGNMVLHVIVSRDKLNIFSFALKHADRPANNDMKNIYGLTPISLACVLGKANIFKEIIEFSCQEFWTYNIVTCCGYPLNVVDSMQAEAHGQESRSALDIILEGDSNEHLNMLKGGVIQKLLEEKWKTFGQRLFLRRIIQTMVHLIVISLAIYLRSPNSQPMFCESNFKKVFRTTIEVLAVLSCVRYIFTQTRDLLTRRKMKLALCQSMTSSVPQIIFLLSNILIIFCLLFRLFDNKYYEEIFLILALPSSWFFLMFFAAAVRITGPFVSMVRFMILQDMRQFSIIYMVFLYGFSQAFYFLLKRPVGETKALMSMSGHKSYYTSWMDLFRMTLGAHEYEVVRNSYYHWFTQFFFVLFMILMPILLLNMLIAMMGNTYALVISESEREWTMQWAKTLLELERSLSKKETKLFLSQYTISISPKSETERPVLMVIKKMAVSKAKKRRQAVNNWKRIYRRLKITTKVSDVDRADKRTKC